MADTTMTDPLGREIVLHDRTWYGHVVKGHPEVARYRDLVVAAVTGPAEVRHSTSDADCRVYSGRGPRPSVMMAVVADVVAGIVRTVYLTKKPSAGVLEWSSPKQ